FYRTDTTATYTLSLHDALPISHRGDFQICRQPSRVDPAAFDAGHHAVSAHVVQSIGVELARHDGVIKVAGISSRYHISNLISERSEEHTSELQSRGHLVCRLLL